MISEKIDKLYNAGIRELVSQHLESGNSQNLSDLERQLI